MRAGLAVQGIVFGGVLAAACVPPAIDGGATPATERSGSGSGGGAGRNTRDGSGGGGGASTGGAAGAAGTTPLGGSGGGAGNSSTGSGGNGSGGSSTDNGGGGAMGQADALTMTPPSQDAAPRDLAGEAAPDAVSVPTFTKIWTSLLMPSCATAACHARKDPPDGIDMHTPATAYATLLAKAINKTDPAKSKVVTLIETKKMPPGGKPTVPPADLADLKAWIAAGDKND